MGCLFAQSVVLQNLPKEFRGGIGANYHDLDMINAHPTILLQYCQKNDIKCKICNVNSRDEVIQKIIIDYN